MDIYDKIKKGQEENISIMKSVAGETIEDFIEKAKKAAVGEIHVWNGIKVRKTHDGWEPVKMGEGKKSDGDKSDYKKGDEVLIASYNDETGRYDNWDDAHLGHVTDVSKLSEGKIKVQYSDMGGEPEPPVERDVKTIKSKGKTGGSSNESAVTDLVMNQPKSKSGKDFFDVVVDYAGEPDDDGESESALVDRLMKMGDKKLGKFIDEFKVEKGDKKPTAKQRNDAIRYAHSKTGDIKKSLSAIEIMNQNDVIEKSHIIHDFSYGEEFKFSKKGKELKQKFAEAILDEVKEIKKYMAELQALMVEIGELPIVPAGDRQYYKVDGYEGKLAEMPNFYDVDEWIPKGDQNELSQKKVKYNNIVNRVIDCSIEMVLLNTFTRNLDDNKEYKLNVTQASKLGL